MPKVRPDVTGLPLVSVTDNDGVPVPQEDFITNGA
jgi:hypothetical protein